MKVLKDKNGVIIEVGMNVLVPKGNKTDIHTYEFFGTVDDFDEDHGLVTVSDQDGDFFEIEANRLEIQKKS